MSMSSSSGTTSAASSPSSRAVGRSTPLARAGHFLFKSRDLLLPLVLLLIGLGTWPRIARGDVRVDHMTDAIGLLVSLTGQALRVLVIGLVVDELAGTAPAFVLVGIAIGIIAGCIGFWVRVRAALR